MSSRTWVKLYCDKWLTGTIREETPAVRGIFVDLLALAGGGEFGDSGVISLKNGVGMSDSQYRKILKVSKTEWRNAKKRLILTERILMNDQNVITISNWKKYQSEYERTKKYRTKSTEKSTTESITGDRDKDKEYKESVEKVTKKGKTWKVVN